MNKKYLKTYTGRVSGSFMGYDDGQPEEKRVFYSNYDDLILEYGTKEDEKYYKLEKLDFNIGDEEKDKVRQDIVTKRAEKQKQEDLDKLKRLQEKIHRNNYIEDVLEQENNKLRQINKYFSQWGAGEY